MRSSSSALRAATLAYGLRLIRGSRFLELQGELADHALEACALAFEPALGWCRRLERFGGIGQELIAPLVVLAWLSRA